VQRSFQPWKIWDSRSPEFQDQDFLGEGVEFITQAHNYPAHDTTFQKKGIYIRLGISSVQQSNAHEFHPKLVSHVFLYLLNYTKLLDVSNIYSGRLQGVRGHKIVTTYSYIYVLQGVPLATEPGIYLIILPLMRILQLNLKRTYLIV
jgi:hypothetical protein